jgi:hypothetical protein
MFKSIKRLLIATAAIIAVSGPSAYAMVLKGAGVPTSTSGQGQPPVVLSVPRTTSPVAFQWGDAGIGAAALLVLIVAGAGATLVLRRRPHQPLAG